MVAALLLVLTAVTLTGPFGEASATAIEVDGELSVTVQVAVDPAFGAGYVVVHVLNPEGQETIPLGRSAAGGYGGTFRIAPANRAVVFEAGRADDFSVSETVSLVDLGVDSDLLQVTFTPDPAGTESRELGWLVVAAAAVAGLGILGWAVRPRSKSSHAVVDTDGRAAVIDEAD